MTTRSYGNFDLVRDDDPRIDRLLFIAVWVNGHASFGDGFLVTLFHGPEGVVKKPFGAVVERFDKKYEVAEDTRVARSDSEDSVQRMAMRFIIEMYREFKGKELVFARGPKDLRELRARKGMRDFSAVTVESPPAMYMFDRNSIMPLDGDKVIKANTGVEAGRWLLMAAQERP